MLLQVLVCLGGDNGGGDGPVTATLTSRLDAMFDVGDISGAGSICRDELVSDLFHDGTSCLLNIFCYSVDLAGVCGGGSGLHFGQRRSTWRGVAASFREADVPIE